MAIIDKPSDYFNTKLYTGNGGAQTITGVNFEPDLIWIKQRNGTGNHVVTDTVRTVDYQLHTNTTDADSSLTNNVTSTNSDGFVVNTDGEVNGSSDTYVAWNWLGANGTASNSNGSITATVSANTTSGCSIVKWSGSGSNATIGHGLGVAPSVVITKSIGGSSAWGVYHISLGNTKILFLNETGAVGTNVAYWNNTSPTSSVFTVGSDAAVNHSGNDMIAYCFTEITNYSKFGFYVGDALNKGGPFVYTGFRPAWIMIKRTDGADTWTMYDNKRIGYNVDNNPLFANANTTESTDDDLDILSNGFKIKRNSGRINTDGANMVYMAFAENPFVTSTDNGSIPATAR